MCGSWMGELTIRSMESRVKEFFGGGFIILSQTKLGTVCVCWGLILGMLSWSCKTLQKWVLCSSKQVVSVHAAECCGTLTSLLICAESSDDDKITQYKWEEVKGPLNDKNKMMSSGVDSPVLQLKSLVPGIYTFK